VQITSSSSRRLGACFQLGPSVRNWERVGNSVLRRVPCGKIFVINGQRVVVKAIIDPVKLATISVQIPFVSVHVPSGRALSSAMRRAIRLACSGVAHAQRRPTRFDHHYGRARSSSASSAATAQMVNHALADKPMQWDKDSLKKVASKKGLDKAKEAENVGDLDRPVSDLDVRARGDGFFSSNISSRISLHQL
jgi:hypothetical protein